jgi:peptide/nickel transport system permease protein
MTAFVARRLGAMALTLVAVSVLVFLLLEISPGSVATKVLGPYANEEQRRLWLEAHGYLRPPIERYFTWLGNALMGDFGQSIRFRAPVGDILWPRLWNTAILAFWTMAALAPLSLILGTLAGMRAGSWLDRIISLFSILTTSLPAFASATLLAAIFVFALQLLPGTSAMSDGFDARQLILPAAVLVIYDLGYVTRITRASVAEAMTKPYVRAARLKGLPFRRVVLRHALRNALIAPLTVLLLHVNWLLSGVIVVEFFFAYKGFGALLLEASLNQDIFLIEACALVAVAVAVTTQTASDIGYALLDPRIRVR